MNNKIRFLLKSKVLNLKSFASLVLTILFLIQNTGLVYAATFTAGQAKRDVYPEFSRRAPGPLVLSNAEGFTGAPVVQGIGAR